MTVGIIACVEVTPTATTPGTTPLATATPSPTTSGTTTLPTDIDSTTICQKLMGQVGTAYVPSVQYSVQPLPGTNDADLTSPTGSGITFPSQPNQRGVVDANNQPIYTITVRFSDYGVNSLGNVMFIGDSNVDKFSVEFYDYSNINQLITYTSPSGTTLPVSYTSTLTESQLPMVDVPGDAPTELSGIRITILSTKDNQ